MHGACWGSLQTLKITNSKCEYFIDAGCSPGCAGAEISRFDLPTPIQSLTALFDVVLSLVLSRMRPTCGYAHNHTQLLVAFLLLRLKNREECHLEMKKNKPGKWGAPKAEFSYFGWS